MNTWPSVLIHMQTLGSITSKFKVICNPDCKFNNKLNQSKFLLNSHNYTTTSAIMQSLCSM